MFNIQVFGGESRVGMIKKLLKNLNEMGQLRICSNYKDLA